jgi:hypothetical protein
MEICPYRGLRIAPTYFKFLAQVTDPQVFVSAGQRPFSAGFVVRILKPGALCVRPPTGAFVRTSVVPGVISALTSSRNDGEMAT